MTRHPRTAARRDANETEIVQVLRDLGCSVHQIYTWADLIVGLGNPPVTVIVEIKQPGQAERLTHAEVKFRGEHLGQYRVLASVEDAIAMIEQYRMDEW